MWILRELFKIVKGIGSLFGETFASWSEDNAFRLAAALAYYAVFSLAPLLIIAIAVAGRVFGEQAAEGQVISQIQGLIGHAGAQTIQGLIENASKANSRLASGLGILSLIFGATGVFVSLQDGLNTVWQVKPKPRNMVVGFVRQRLHTFTMVLGIAFLLLVSLVVSAAIAAVGKYFHNGAALLWEFGNLIVSIAIITLLFAMIFRFLPDVNIAWSDVWLGAFVTAVLFTLGKFAIGLYIGKSSLTSVYGAAGSLVLILAWVYYSSLILFLGAEFTRAYATRYGSRITPAKNAVPLTPELRAQQGMEPYVKHPPAA
jgi:membrane protein